MYILTAINRSKDLVSIFDTRDKTNESISLQIIANKVLKKELFIYGIHRLDDAEGCNIFPEYGVAVCESEASRAMKDFCVRNEMSEKDVLERLHMK